MLESYIDHTYLQPVGDVKLIERLCEEAKTYRFASVCVHPYFLPVVCRELQHTNIGIGTVIGFPFGANLLETKIMEARHVIAAGATEVDMVMNLSCAKEGLWDYVQEEIEAVKKEVGVSILKVILETCYLTESEKIKACEVCIEAGADFVKTSTGFGSRGAITEDVELMRKIVGSQLGVKASGGIRDKETALAMIRAGATRLGTSAGVAIITS